MSRPCESSLSVTDLGNNLTLDVLNYDITGLLARPIVVFEERN